MPATKPKPGRELLFLIAHVEECCIEPNPTPSRKLTAVLSPPLSLLDSAPYDDWHETREGLGCSLGLLLNHISSHGYQLRSVDTVERAFATDFEDMGAIVFERCRSSTDMNISNPSLDQNVLPPSTDFSRQGSLNQTLSGLREEIAVVSEERDTNGDLAARRHTELEQCLVALQRMTFERDRAVRGELLESEALEASLAERNQDQVSSELAESLTAIVSLETQAEVGAAALAGALAELEQERTRTNMEWFQSAEVTALRLEVETSSAYAKAALAERDEQMAMTELEARAADQCRKEFAIMQESSDRLLSAVRGEVDRRNMATASMAKLSRKIVTAKLATSITPNATNSIDCEAPHPRLQIEEFDKQITEAGERAQDEKHIRIYHPELEKLDIEVTSLPRGVRLIVRGMAADKTRPDDAILDRSFEYGDSNESWQLCEELCTQAKSTRLLVLQRAKKGKFNLGRVAAAPLGPIPEHSSANIGDARQIFVMSPAPSAGNGSSASSPVFGTKPTSQVGDHSENSLSSSENTIILEPVF